LAYVVVGVLLLGFVGVYALVAVGNSISEQESSVAGLEQELASATARAEALQGFASLASLEQSRTETVSSLAGSRFDWERVMRELALVIPQDVTLATLSGAITGSSESSEASSGGGAIEAPNLTMAGCATDQESVAQMLSALRDIDGVTRVGLSNTASTDTKSGGDGGVASAASCPADKTYAFELTVAFDEVTVDPATGGVLPPAEDAPVPGDGSGITEASQEQQRAQDSVDSAERRSRDAVDTFVPGT
jgi:Tfp pilus assembly protein PilN